MHIGGLLQAVAARERSLADFHHPSVAAEV